MAEETKKAEQAETPETEKETVAKETQAQEQTVEETPAKEEEKKEKKKSKKKSTVFVHRRIWLLRMALYVVMWKRFYPCLGTNGMRKRSA